MKDFGFTQLVSREDNFATELTESSKWRERSGSGIYSWVTENLECYTGQAVSVRRRLLQHAKQHPDLLYVAFQSACESELDALEETLIKRVETIYPTRNIKHASKSVSSVPFDLVVSAADQELFLSGLDIDNATGWKDWPALEVRQAKRFAKLKNDPDFKAIVGCLNHYIVRCVPAPADTEVRFWSVSLFSQTGTILRLNAGQQEVFTIVEFENELFARPLALRRLDPTSYGPLYKTESWDSLVPILEFERWLADWRRIACRKLVVNLMRHTTTLNSGSHCPQVVRANF